MKREHILICILVLCTIFYTGFYSQFHVDPHHDGIILKPAVDVIARKRLFVDTFTQYGALTTLIQAAFMKAFGATLVVQRFSAIVFYAVSSFFLYLLSRRLFSPSVSFGVGLMWLVTAYFPNREIIVPFMAWSSVYSLTFQLISTWFFVLFLERKNRLPLFLSGFFCALTFWARQPVGVFLSLGIGALLATRVLVMKEKLKTVSEGGLFLFGITAACISFFLWLLSIHGVHDWWQQSIVLAFNFGNNLSGHFSVVEIFARLLPSVIDSKKNLLWLAAIFSSWLLFFVQLFRFSMSRTKINTHTWVLFTFSVISLASWMQFFPANDQSHFFWAGTPMLIVLVFMIGKIVSFLLVHGAEELQINKKYWVKPVGKVVSLGVVLFLLMGFFVTDVKGLRWYISTPFETLSSPPVLVGMRVPADEQIVLDRVQKRLADYFDIYPSKTYVNASPDALYTLIDPHIYNFHKAPMYWDWTVKSVFTDYYSSLFAYVKTHRPLIIMRDPIEFTDYCSDDLSIHYPVRIQMYQRPLIIRIPTEDIVTMTASAGAIHLLPKVGEIVVKTATFSAGSKPGGVIATGSASTLIVPLGAEKVYLDMTNDLAGECNVIISLQ